MKFNFMKVKHQFLALSALSILSLAACKKEDTTDNQQQQPTVAERIQAKWSIESLQYHEEMDGEVTDTTAAALSTDYFDIRPDSKIYVSFYSQKDTLNYALQNDSTLTIKDLFVDGDGTFKIRTLTDNSLKLYTKETDSSDAANFFEGTFNLKK